MTTTTLTHRATHSKAMVLHFPRMRWKLWYAMAVVLALFFVVLYIIQINQLTGGTYVIKNYNKQIAALSEENKNLEIRFANSSFLAKSIAQAEAQDFEKTTAVTYVQILDDSLAQASGIRGSGN